MSGKPLAAIRAIIRQVLRDEVAEDLEWEDDELDIHINECLLDISHACPYEVIETLNTTEGSTELDISSIANLLDIDEVEYPVGKTPKAMRSCNVFGNTLTIETDLSPAANEDVYLYCHKVHQLTQSSSTLNANQERVLVLGVSGKAAIAKSRSLINKVNIGGAKVPGDMQAWGINQLTLYRAGLNEITKPRIYISRSRA